MLTLNEKIIASPLGLEIRNDLSFEEWSSLAPQIGTALRSMSFVIGDWLVYGEDRFHRQLALPEIEAETTKRTRVSAERYRAAQQATGIDRVVLKDYAYVCRRVPMSLRTDLLSWEHHRAVAKLEAPEQQRWLAVASNPDDKLSSRRLRVSIIRGRVVSAEEMAIAPAEQGISNHIPSINRLCGWWQMIGGKAWVKTRTREQLDALKRDFEPVLAILRELEAQ